MLELAYALAGAALASAYFLIERQVRRTKPDAASTSMGVYWPAEGLPSMTNVKNRACDKHDELRRRIRTGIDAIAEQPLSVRQVMSPDVAQVQPSTRLEEIAAIMGERRIRHIPVVDARGRLMGMVSDRDVAVRRGETARDVMSLKPVTISCKATMAEAVEIMLSRNISSLPVYDGDEICGILTSADVMLGLQCACDALRSKLLQSNAALSVGAT